MQIDTKQIEVNKCWQKLIIGFNSIRWIFLQGVQPPVLIFVQSKERARELFHELIYDGMNVDVIHSDQTQEQVN